MEVVNDLTLDELLKLKGSIGSLESTIPKLYLSREPRELLGEEGILVRTLGANYVGPVEREPKYFDSRREGDVDTEFSEVVEAFEIYDADPSRENEVELLLEVGDVLFQKEIVKLKHRDNVDYDNVISQFNSALNYIVEELGKRGLFFDKARKLTEVKYGSRAWLGVNGRVAKDKGLERMLCLEIYETGV